jgi:hypothetical protein
MVPSFLAFRCFESHVDREFEDSFVYAFYGLLCEYNLSACFCLCVNIYTNEF